MTSNKIELPYGMSREDLMSAIAEITAPPKQEQRKWSQLTGIQQIEQNLNTRLSTPHSNAILIAQQSAYMHRIALRKCSPWKIAIFSELNLYFSCAQYCISYIVEFVRKRLFKCRHFQQHVHWILWFVLCINRLQWESDLMTEDKYGYWCLEKVQTIKQKVMTVITCNSTLQATVQRSIWNHRYTN